MSHYDVQRTRVLHALEALEKAAAKDDKFKEPVMTLARVFASTLIGIAESLDTIAKSMK